MAAVCWPEEVFNVSGERMQCMKAMCNSKHNIYIYTICVYTCIYIYIYIYMYSISIISTFSRQIESGACACYDAHMKPTLEDGR